MTRLRFNTPLFMTAGLIGGSFIGLLASTQQAHALSCMRPDPVQICKSMDKPVWAKGQLRLNKVISQEKNEGSIGGQGPAVADYLFTGTVNDQSGMREVTDAKVRITTSCAGPWCAKLPEDKKAGNFLLKSDDKTGMSLHLGACDFQPYGVTEAQEKAIQACVTPQPVKPVKNAAETPKAVEPKGSSQIYSQSSRDKKLVE